MSIVRMGLGEKKGYHDGYDAIFKKKAKPAAAKKAAPAKKAAAKKPAVKAAKKK